MDVTFLGTGGSYPSTDRNVSATVINHHSTQILLDCGEGTQRQFMQSNLSFMKTSHILISHYHGDHFLGLPGLIQSMALNGREDPLYIHGPKGLKELALSLMSLGYFNATFDVFTHEVESGETFPAGNMKVKAVMADHSVPNLAYRINAPEKPGKFNKKKALELGIPEGPLFGKLQKGESIVVEGRTIEPEEVMGSRRKGVSLVYSGDTKPCESVQELSRGATALVHEATTLDDLKEKMDAYGHSTAAGAAKLAKDAGVGRLFLVHLSSRYKDGKAHIAEASDIFSNVAVPKDFDHFRIS